MKIALVTGSYPPDLCGVGDYVAKLARALRKEGADTTVFHPRQWDVGSAFAHARALSCERNLVVHYQYPTVGYGYNLGPQLLAMLKRGVVTIHEFSMAHLLRKASLLPFCMASKHVILSSEFERNKIAAAFPGIRSRTEVIPIGSNISPSSSPRAPRTNAILYFGMIMPKKGIEEFLLLAKIAQSSLYSARWLIAGGIPEGKQEYYANLRAISSELPVEWYINRSAEEISELLGSAAACYLPFPEGASERRGSLKACLASGTPTISKIGRHTTSELSNTIIHAARPHDAFAVLVRIMESEAEWKSWSEKSLVYAKTFDWEVIAKRHLELYRELKVDS